MATPHNGSGEPLPEAADSEKLRCLRGICEEVCSFQQLCQDLRQQVQLVAKQLISNIQHHEERLLEELATRQDTELRKLGPGLADLRTLTPQLTQQGADDIFAMDTDKPVSEESLSTLLYENTAVSEAIDQWLEDDRELELPALAFVAVRCNTAFGTIEDIQEGDTISKEICSSPTNYPSRKTSWRTNPAQVRSGTASPHLPRSSPGSSEPYLNIEAPTRDYILRRVHSARERELRRHSSITEKPSSPRVKRSLSVREGVHGGLVSRLLWEVSVEGSQPGEVQCPSSVAFLHSGDLAVADKDNDRIQVFSPNGKYQRTIGQGKVRPRRLSITAEGHIAVTDAKEECIKVFTEAGDAVSGWGKKRLKTAFKCPCAIATTTKGHLVVSDIEKQSVGVYQPDGKCVRQLGSSRSNSSAFQSPLYASTDHMGRILVSDNSSHTVKVFDAQGTPQFQISELSPSGEHLKFPNGVCVDCHGNILVADWGNHSVGLFNPDGIFLRQLLSRSDGLYHPADIAVHGKNLLALTEFSDGHSALKMFKIITS